jgi:exodeoxyribonuclease VII small subunit
VARAKRTPASKLSFGEAVGEVEEILARLEEDAIDIDDLGAEVRRAVELIKVCREKLSRTDAEVRELVAELDADGADDRDVGDADRAVQDGGGDAAAGAADGPAAGASPSDVLTF